MCATLRIKSEVNERAICVICLDDVNMSQVALTSASLEHFNGGGGDRLVMMMTTTAANKQRNNIWTEKKNVRS
jgi:hypothetical protein